MDIYYLWADISWDDGDETDSVNIGVYSTPELLLDAARNWLKKEYDEDELDANYCLCACRGKMNESILHRIDLSDRPQDIELTKSLRIVEKQVINGENYE